MQSCCLSSKDPVLMSPLPDPYNQLGRAVQLFFSSISLGEQLPCWTSCCLASRAMTNQHTVCHEAPYSSNDGVAQSAIMFWIPSHMCSHINRRAVITFVDMTTFFWAIDCLMIFSINTFPFSSFVCFYAITIPSPYSLCFFPRQPFPLT